MKSEVKCLSRRQLLGSALAVSAAAAPVAVAGQAGQAPATDAITADDLAVVDKVAGRAYGEKERALMVRSMGRIREQLKSIREFDLDASTEPAFHFDPRLPGTPVPAGKPSFRSKRIW